MNVNIPIADNRESPVSSQSPSNPTVSQSAIAPAGPKGTMETYCPFLSFEFYMPFFNVSSKDIALRILYSFIPIRAKFVEEVGENPDLYGPFWIYTTLILFLAAGGNLSRFLVANQNGTTADYGYDFDFIPNAVAVVYGLGFIFPLALYILMRVFGSKTTYMITLCIYGYSTTVYIPMIVLAAFPSDTLQWVAIIVALVFSTLFLLVNFWRELSQYVEKSRHIVLGVILFVQVTLLLVFKFYFFGKVFSGPKK
eukprot:TRINITY_DN4503_c0_g2_i1.p1 TRINITY_DN4503_c0_g2~~TRINITY_DN4503_c0_g2_i1.p1  ORF type:complete len:253 (+),score=45.99 TRINITY_DN4503_c0_g2_i1:442-1200(+)